MCSKQVRISNKESYTKLIYIERMSVIRSTLERYLSRTASKESAELREVAASQDSLYALCDTELDEIEARKNELIKRKNALIEQTDTDVEFDQAQFRMIQQQIRKLILQEKEWEFRKIFHLQIRDICLFLSEHLSPNIHQEITELTKKLLDDMIDIYFSTKNRNGRAALSLLDIKLQAAREEKNPTRILKYEIKRKVCSLFFAIAERNNEVNLANIKFLLFTNNDAEENLRKLERDRSAILPAYRPCIYSLQDILRELEEPGCKSSEFIEKVSEVFAFAQQQTFVSSTSLLELSRSVQMHIEPNSSLEAQLLTLKKIKCESKTHLYNIKIELYLCQLDILQDHEPRLSDLSQQMQEDMGILNEEIFDQATMLEILLDKVRKSQSVLDSHLAADSVKSQLLHQLALQKSKLLASILRMGKVYLQMQMNGAAREAKLARFALIYEYYEKEHQNKYVIGSETILSVSMQVNMAIRFLFVDYELLSELLSLTLADFIITTEILTMFPTLTAEEDDWSSDSDDDQELSGMLIPPPPIPEQDVAGEEEGEILEEVVAPIERGEEPAEEDEPPIAQGALPQNPRRTPSPAAM